MLKVDGVHATHLPSVFTEPGTKPDPAGQPVTVKSLHALVTSPSMLLTILFRSAVNFALLFRSPCRKKSQLSC